MEIHFQRLSILIVKWDGLKSQFTQEVENVASEITKISHRSFGAKSVFLKNDLQLLTVCHFPLKWKVSVLSRLAGVDPFWCCLPVAGDLKKKKLLLLQCRYSSQENFMACL